jgi:hypothetical protein
LEDVCLWGFDEIAVLFEDEFYLAVGDGAVADEVYDACGQGDFGEAAEDGDDVLCLEAD